MGWLNLAISTRTLDSALWGGCSSTHFSILVELTHELNHGFAFEPAYRGWTTKDRSAPGYIGSPQAATAEKGEHLFQTFSNGVCQFLDQVIAWDGKSWEMA